MPKKKPKTIKRKMTWYIQVCRTCYRQAEWPFCEHRDQVLEANRHAWASPAEIRDQTPPWCMYVRVTGTVAVPLDEAGVPVDSVPTNVQSISRGVDS